MDPFYEQEKSAGRQPAGAGDTAESTSNASESKHNLKSYADYKAAAKTKEYAWITTSGDQALSDALDRVMTHSSHWRNMYRTHGREVACLELMFTQFSIEAEYRRRDWQEKEDARKEAIRYELEQHLAVRNRVRLLQERQLLDNCFIAEQEAKGYSDNVFQLMQVMKWESEWAEQVAWDHEKKLRALEAEAEKSRLKDVAKQRQAERFAKAVRSEAERLVKDIIISGAFSGR